MSQLSFAQVDTLATFTKEVAASSDSLSITQRTSPIAYEKDVGNIINTLSTVYLKSYGMGGISSVSVRGGGASQTNVIWNGVSINSPTLGQTDFSILPAEFYNTIAINPGGHNTGDNQTGIAGTVTLDNTVGFSRQQSIIAKKNLGSFGYDRTSIKATLSSKKWLSETTLIKWDADNDFTYQDYSQAKPIITSRENASFSQKGVQQLIAVKLKNGLLKWVGNYVNTFREVAPAIGVLSQNARQQDESWKNVLSLKMYGNENRKIDRTHHFQLGHVNDYLLYNSDALSSASEVITNILDIQYNSHWYLPKRIELNTQLIHRLSSANSGGFPTVKTRNHSGAFLQLTKNIKRFVFKAQARQIYIDNNFLPLVYGAGAEYLHQKSFRLSISANRNVHAPTLNDLYWEPGGNSNLIPEESRQLDLVSSFFALDQITITAKGFFSQIDNWIQWLPQESAIWSPINVKSVQKNGGELEINYVSKKRNAKIKPEIRLGYQYLDAVITKTYLSGDQSLDKRPIYIPEHSLAISSAFRLNRLIIQYEQKITSKVYIDALNTTYLPYTAPANFRLTYTFGKNHEAASVSLNVMNVYNETYQTIANQPLPGRYFEIGLKVYFSDQR